MFDWHTSKVVYQIFPDRFNIGDGKTAKQKENEGLYPLPGQRTVDWKEKPKRTGDRTKQLLFWGGDLKGITEKIDYIKSLGAEIIYLTPIFYAHTNHKYDTIDFFRIDPAFGTLQDFKELCETAHQNDLKIILDGVFNHVGFASKWFNGLNLFPEKGAYQSPDSPYRDYFYFSGDKYRSWVNSGSLPELNLENPELQEILFTGENSVVKYWLKQGADGWRIDCAHDIGNLNHIIVEAAKSVKPDALIIGEVWNYPKGWNEFAGLDGIMNYHFRSLVIDLLKAAIPVEIAARIMKGTVEDCGVDYLSKCWNILSSHDVPRLSNTFDSERDIQLAIALQFSFPGVPMIYYGEELEMTGGEDPENRDAMRWENLNSSPERFNFYKKMTEIRKKKTALQKGKFNVLHNSQPDKIMAFKRSMERIDDLVLIAFNFSHERTQFKTYINESTLMTGTLFRDLFTGETFRTDVSNITLQVEPRSFRILEPIIERVPDRYTPYKRV